MWHCCNGLLNDLCATYWHMERGLSKLISRRLRAIVLAMGLAFAAAPLSWAEVPGPIGQRSMRLSVGPQFEIAAIVQSQAREKIASNCGKWRRVAARLGETYAGARFRQSIVERACAFADTMPVEDTAWSWPWAKSEIDGELPPRLHASFASWTIRCGHSGRRERCALIHEAKATVAPAAGALDAINIITHFVIDQIGGQEHVLWRVFVEKPDPIWFGGSAAPVGRTHVAQVVRTHADAATIHKRFDDCSRFGCLMEADIGVSAQMATRLWDGAGILIEVRPAPGIVITQSVPAGDFRRGLRELSRLKHAEERLLAGR